MPSPRSEPRPRSVGAPAEGLALPPGLAAVLGAAFRPPEAPAEPAADAPLFLETAARTGFLPRIVHRLGPTLLSALLGPRGAEEALERYRASAFASARLVALGRLVGRVAREEGLRVVPLKHVALCEGGVTSPAARGAVDADLLVADADAARLVEALSRAGLRSTGDGARDHQHRPLVHGRGGLLELHRTIPGVRASPDGRELDLESVVRHGLAVPAGGGAPLPLVPGPRLLLAHALAHGLYQHGLAPDAYSAFKLLADAADLREAAGPGLLGEALPLVSSVVHADDASAAWKLPALLADGGLEAVLSRPESPEARLLAHFVRGAYEPGYAEALKLRAATAPRAGRGPVRGLLRNAWDAVAIGPSQARVLYGADTRAKYAAALALRPFHLCAKLVRYAVAALRR